ncbi:hypothetical protein CAPTEDRAFT_27304, partial [Capitella teleta]
FKIGLKIHRYWMPVIILLGWIGNILSLAVFSRPKNRKISCCLYMCGLAVTDSCVILASTYYYLRTTYEEFVQGGDLTQIQPSTLECRITAWLHNFGLLSSVLIIMTMTVDRFIGVRFPLLASRLCTVKRARIFLAILPFCAGAYTFPYFLYAK